MSEIIICQEIPRRYAVLLNSNADPSEPDITPLWWDKGVDGVYFSPTPLTLSEWQDRAQDLECAYGVWLNDAVRVKECPPVDEDEHGWWGWRTPELLDLWHHNRRQWMAEVMLVDYYGDRLPEGVAGDYCYIQWV